MDYQAVVVQRPPRPQGARHSPESRYWRQFKRPVFIKEYAPVTAVHFAPAKPHRYAVTAATRVQIYAPRTQKVVKTISRFKDVARSAHLRHDGKLLVAGDDTGLVQVRAPLPRLPPLIRPRCSTSALAPSSAPSIPTSSPSMSPNSPPSPPPTSSLAPTTPPSSSGTSPPSPKSSPLLPIPTMSAPARYPPQIPISSSPAHMTQPRGSSTLVPASASSSWAHPPPAPPPSNRSSCFRPALSHCPLPAPSCACGI